MRGSNCPRCGQFVVYGKTKQFEEHVNFNCSHLAAIQILGNMEMTVFHLIETNYIWRVKDEECILTKEALQKIRDYIDELLKE